MRIHTREKTSEEKNVFDKYKNDIMVILHTNDIKEEIK